MNLGLLSIVLAGLAWATPPPSAQPPRAGTQAKREGLATPASDLALKPADLSARLRRVEQTVADVGPLSTSLRQVPPDFRTPADFRDVYQIPPGSNSPYAGWFARQNGGVTAVFPRSQYDLEERGLRAVIPADTRFILGKIPMGDELVGPGPNTLSLRVDQRAASTGAGASQLDARVSPLRIDTRAVAPLRWAESAPPARPTEPPASPQQLDAANEARVASTASESVARLFLDDSYRAGRVDRLLGLSGTRPAKP